jgi:hypothetical protein
MQAHELEMRARPANVNSEGVSKGRISLQKFVEVSSSNHAKIYGLSRKGAIAVGYDADIALWDPNKHETIRQEILHHGADYTVPIANPIRWRLTGNWAMLPLDVGLMQTDLWGGDRSAAVARNARGRDFGAEAANQCAAACQSQETSIWVD